MERRDMTKRQFNEACKRHGFVPEPFLGYVRLGDTKTSVSILNCGTSRREQLAYLIERHEEATERREAALVNQTS